jgi:hypothetical protein
MIAINPKILDVLKILSEVPAKAAMIAPTIITDEIALVTDIKRSMKRWSNAPYNIITNKN